MEVLQKLNVDEQFAKEDSRIVKICLVKYKCILILTLILVCVGQLIYLFVSTVTKDKELMEILKVFAYNFAIDFKKLNKSNNSPLNFASNN